MRLLPGMILVFAACVWAQSEESPEIVRAKAGIERLRSLVEAGAAPRAQLEKAEAALADAEDAAYLRKTVYGTDLTEAQTDDMMAAAAAARGPSQDTRSPTAKADRDRGRVAACADSGAGGIRSGAQGVRPGGIARAFRQADGREARAEESLEASLNQSPEDAPVLGERYDGDGTFSMVAFSRSTGVREAFGKTLPVSAMGETAVHRSLGFDHRGRVDVAIHPDHPKGTGCWNIWCKITSPTSRFARRCPARRPARTFTSAR